MRNVKFAFLLTWLGMLFFSPSRAAVSVTNIAATYRNGQVFITWTYPQGSNYKYNIYRSKLKLNLKSKLNSTSYLGYVIDSSSLNLRKTRKTGSNVYYIIEDGGSPLTSDKGLYVVTCDSNASYYYAVTVTDLSMDTEYKKITIGSNSLSRKITEMVADPQPVLQGTEIFSSTGDEAYNYVWFGNNQDLPNFPVMFNQGFYGFNFNLIYRGNYQGGPLFMFHEGLEGNALVGNGLGTFDTLSNCIILSNDDWIPVPNGYGSTSGENTFWTGYHENFNPYILNNPVPTTGTVRMYQQHRYIHTINWGAKYLPIDSNRIYLVGVSAGGFGALVTAMMVPQKIAAVYTIVAPIIIKSSPLDGDESSDEQMWGTGGDNLPCDVIDPTTGEPLATFDLMNIKTMLKKNENQGLPPIYSIHGKNDKTVTWNDKPNYLAQNETYDQGGIHFWDQREHNGDGANFYDSETTPDFTRFRKNLSYPAFAKCSANENPGNGTPSNGDPYGSYSGFITWDTVTDNACSWTCHMTMPDFKVGGVIKLSDNSYCYADVTIRRPQMFHPQVEDVLKWTNYDKNNVKIASGTITYQGGPVTIEGIKVKRNGSLLEISINSCSAKEEGEEVDSEIISGNFSVNNTFRGWKVNIISDQQQSAQLQLSDVLGRTLENQTILLTEGTNTFEMKAPQHGTYVIKVEGIAIHQAIKAVF